jgi:PAS domain S-box-containing protein
MNDQKGSDQPAAEDAAELRRRTADLEEELARQKDAESALQESEERFRKVFEEGPLGVVLLGLDLQILHCNQRFCEMMGCSEKEIIALRLVGITHPEDWEKTSQFGSQLLCGTIPRYTMEKRYVRKDGTSFRGQLTVSMMHDAEGRPTAAIGMIEDVSEPKRAEEALRKSERTLRTLIDANPESLVLLDTQGTILIANESAAYRLGKTVAEVTGQNVHGLIPGDVAARRDEYMAEAVRTGKPVCFEDERSGRHFESTIHPVTDETGRVTTVAVLGIDRTRRKRIEKALRESEERYRMLAETTTDIIGIHDRNGTLLYGNRAWALSLGFDPNSIVGLTQQELFPPDVAQKHIEAIGTVFQTGDLLELTDEAYPHGSGEIWLHTWLMPLKNERGQVTSVMSVSHDVTNRKQAEMELKKARDELQRQVAETRLNEARLEAVLQLNHMTGAPLQEITDFALEQAVALTRSKIGYLAFMDEKETALTMHSWSRDAMAECAVADKPLVYPMDTTGLWGEAARQRRPIVTNDYSAPSPLKKGLPAGHVQLFRHMNVPILDGGRVVIVAGVGNKDEVYDESDVRQLKLLMEGVWALIQRRRVQTELQRHRDHLEQLVTERTELLRQSHNELRAIHDGMSDGIIIADTETRNILGANPAMCRLLGYSEEEMLAMRLEDCHPPGELPGVLREFSILVECPTFLSKSLPFRRKDGSVFYAEAGTNTLTYRARPCVMGIFRDITERKRAEEMLKKEHRTLKHLLQSSDHERQLIAYEIHDGLAQQLAAAIMQFETYIHQKDITPRKAKKAYSAAMTMLRQGHAECRRLISGVRPPILDESGVAAAIAHLVSDRNCIKGPRIEYFSVTDFDRLVPIVENAIYRIVQEGLANACQHSKSETVRVSLVQRECRVQIEIRDWGVGFDVKTVQANRFGLEGIRQRARLLGGKSSIRSKLGKGTRICVELPVVERE